MEDPSPWLLDAMFLRDTPNTICFLLVFTGTRSFENVHFIDELLSAAVLNDCWF